MKTTRRSELLTWCRCCVALLHFVAGPHHLWRGLFDRVVVEGPEGNISIRDNERQQQ